MIATITERFTPTEAAALAGLSERQVRKEIEYQVIDIGSSVRLPFSALVYLYLVPKSSLSLRVSERSSIYKQIVQTLAQEEVPDQIEVAAPFYLHLGDGIEYLDDRVGRFLAWKEQLIVDPAMMGGAETFPGSRLTVRHIGSMLEGGAAAEEILEDYPYLTPEDLEFARIFVLAYPGDNHISAPAQVNGTS